MVEDEVVAEEDLVTAEDGEDSEEEEVRLQGMEKTIKCCHFCYH